MTDTTTLLIQGSLACFRDPEYRDDLKAAGITTELWDRLTGPVRWREAIVVDMVDVLDRAITAAVGGGGVRRVPITAQFLATGIAFLVAPTNWMICSYECTNGLDGVKLVQPDGDDSWNREFISGERLFALVLMAEAMEARAIDGRAAIITKRLELQREEEEVNRKSRSRRRSNG